MGEKMGAETPTSVVTEICKINWGGKTKGKHIS